MSVTDKLKNCPMCRSAWYSTIIIGALTLLCNEFFVLGYPLAHMLIFHLITGPPRTFGSASSAERIVEAYQSAEGRNS